MKFLRLAFLLGIIFAATEGQAQIVSLDTNALTGIQDTVSFGYAIDFPVNVYNNDTSSTGFADTIIFGYRVNGFTGTASTDTTIFPIGQLNITSDSIPFGGHITKTLHIHVQAPFFSTNPSVVVIWPIATHHPGNVDSVSKQIVIRNLLGINEPGQERIKAYLWNQDLVILSDGGSLLKSVRIFNVQGALLLQKEAVTNITTIPMNQFATGIYLAEVTLSNNSKQVFRFFKGQ